MLMDELLCACTKSILNHAFTLSEQTFQQLIAQPYSQIVLETAAIAYSLFSTGRSQLRRQLVWRASRRRAGTITPPGGLLLSPCLSKDLGDQLVFFAGSSYTFMTMTS